MCAGIDSSFLVLFFLKRILKTGEEHGFLFFNPSVEGTVNSKEQKTRIFCQNDVQEFHLWSCLVSQIFLPGFQSIRGNKIIVHVTTFLSLAVGSGLPPHSELTIIMCAAQLIDFPQMRGQSLHIGFPPIRTQF